MPNLTFEQLRAMRGRPVLSADDEEIGEVDQVYFDEESGEPAWIVVKRGLLGMNSVLVPTQEALIQDVRLHVPYSKDQIENAPEPEEVKALSPESERSLSRHYGVAQRPEEPTPVVVRVVRVWSWPQ